SIKNDGHYFCRAGGNRPDGLNEPVTFKINKQLKKKDHLFIAIARQRQLFVTGGLNECSNEMQNFRSCNSRQNREVCNPYSVTSPSWRI
ncbi:hypothetical protein SND97_14500, partial [Escherichia coli]|nr:hypothetical protein [Escherichia coli]